MLRRTAYSAICASILLANSVAAFDGMEHERLADGALVLALSYWLHKKSNANPLTADGLCKELSKYFVDEVYKKSVKTLVRHCVKESENGDPRPITYGGAARVVDEMLYPSRLFVREGGASNSENASVNPHAKSHKDLNDQFNTRREDRRRFKTTNAVLQGYRALSFNEVHFQNDLLLMMRDYQLQALSLADDKYIYKALVANALSDHFLQDFLAPGHILWPRNHSHDSVATSVHDGTNQKGTWFHISEAYWNTCDSDSYCLKNIMDHLKSMPANQKELHDLIQTNYWLHRKVNAGWQCTAKLDNLPPRSGDVAGSIEEGLACLEHALSGDRHINVNGDGMLSKSPAQQALLLLVQTKRLVDLLQVYDGAPREKYENASQINQIASFKESFSKLEVPTARLNFGEYKFNYSENGTKISDNEVFKDTVSGVLILGGGGQAPFRSVGSARYQMSMEYVPLGFIADNEALRNRLVHKPPRACKTFTLCNTGAAVGFDYVHDGSFTARGFSLRFIKAFPAVNLQLSPYAKHLRYRFADQYDWLTSWGVRADWGFSIGSFYITLGKEYYVNDASMLKSTGMFSFGVGLGIPFSRIKKWSVNNRRYMPDADH